MEWDITVDAFAYNKADSTFDSVSRYKVSKRPPLPSTSLHKHKPRTKRHCHSISPTHGFARKPKSPNDNSELTAALNHFKVLDMLGLKCDICRKVVCICGRPHPDLGLPSPHRRDKLPRIRRGRPKDTKLSLSQVLNSRLQGGKQPAQSAFVDTSFY
jgi:hypothetical protein